MDEKKSGGSLIGVYASLVMTIFTFSIIFIAAAGIITGELAPEIPIALSLLGSDGEGIPFRSVLQIGLLSIIISALYVLLLSDRFIKNWAFLWRMILFHASTISTISIFWLIFEWGPWIKTILGLLIFYACCICAGSLIIIKIRLDDKKYNKLLSSYKERHKEQKADNTTV
ncbi:MAG: hypothetical protein LBR96_04270 [Treponema sp.]|jgi:hypothetical protein|nr:hypothetical protein [Treponema sp.]